MMSRTRQGRRFFGSVRADLFVPYEFVMRLPRSGEQLRLLFGEVLSNARLVAFPITWGVFAEWVFGHPRLGTRYPSIIKNIATYVPAAFFFAFFLGANAAHTEMSQSSSSHRIALSPTENGAAGEEVRLLRSFQDWILIRDEKGKVAWIHLNDVMRIQALEETKMFKGFVCLFSTSWCLANNNAE